MSTDSHPATRTLASRFVVGARRGSGLEVATFEGFDQETNEPVVLKLVHPTICEDKPFRLRFAEVMGQTAELHHPNLARVLYYGADMWNGRPMLFVASEHLGGGSLRDLLDRGRVLTASQALMVGLEACKGLDALHRADQFHGDIRPATLIFGDDSRLRVSDAGLSRVISEVVWADGAQPTIDLATYASPERALGEEVGPKSDVYSLALAVVEAATGKVPFVGDSAVSTLANRVDRLLPVNADLGALAAVLERAARPHAEDRYTAAGFGAALLQAAQKMPRPKPVPTLSGGLFAERAPGMDPTGPLVRPGDPTPSRGIGREPQAIERPDLPPAVDADETSIAEFERSTADAEPSTVEPGVAAPVVEEAVEPDVEPALEEGVDSAAEPADTDVEPEPTPAEAESPSVVEAERATLADVEPAASEPTAPEPGAEPQPGEPAPEPAASEPAPAAEAEPAPATEEVTAPATPAPEPPPVRPHPVGVPPIVRRPPEPRPDGTTTPESPAPLSRRAARAQNKQATQVTRVAPPAEPVEVFDQGRRRSLWWIMVPLLLLVAAGGGLAWYLKIRSSEHRLPALAGMTEADARALLKPLDFKLELTESADEQIAAGKIISTDPAEGVTLREGDTVKAVVSSGPAPRRVPSLIGMTLAAATDQLDGDGLVAMRDTDVFDEQVPAGAVVSFTVEGQPAAKAGDDVARGSTIHLVVSKGPKPRKTPQLYGLSTADATTVLDQLDLVLQVGSEAFSSDVLKGSILSQNPAANADIDRNSTVTVVISKGPEMITVPDVSGLSAAGIVGALRNAGLGVDLAASSGDFNGALTSMTFDGKAVRPGDQLPRGTRLILNFAAAPAA